MIIGVTGTLGAGKGTVTEYLVNHKGFAHVAVSDTFLAGEAIKRGRTPDRQARHDIANEYRANGPMKLMEACYELALPDIEAGKDVVIDPQHSVAEVEFIQSKGGFVFAVDADINTRYERIHKRGTAKDNVSFEEFAAIQELEMNPTESSNNDLGGAVRKADVCITNNGTREELHVQIDDVLKKITK
ncbi:MAG: AAA family ATPase [Gallionella sp.]|nr:AAA family ATPase [Gallionella sp.]